MIDPPRSNPNRSTDTHTTCASDSTSSLPLDEGDALVRMVSERLEQGQDWRQLDASHTQDDGDDQEAVTALGVSNEGDGIFYISGHQGGRHSFIHSSIHSSICSLLSMCLLPSFVCRRRPVIAPLGFAS
jgi:hypothetical protein